MIDLDVDSYYPHVMNMGNWMFGKRERPRTLDLIDLGHGWTQRYKVKVNGGDWWEDKEEMIAWCNKLFGAHTKGYNNPRWRQGSFEFFFKNKKDATMFILRWS